MTGGRVGPDPHRVGSDGSDRPWPEREKLGLGGVGRQASAAGRVEAGGIRGERGGRGRHVGGRGLEASLVGPRQVGNGEPQPLADLGRRRVLVVQVEGEGGEADLRQAAAHDVERRALLGDEQHPAPPRDLVGEDVGDGLGLAGARRAFQDEGAPTAGEGNRLGLRAVRGDGHVGDHAVEGSQARIHLCRSGIGEPVGWGQGEVAGNRLGEEPFPVLIEVSPEQVAGETDDGQARLGLDGEGQAGIEEGLAQAAHDLVDIDAALAADARWTDWQLVQSRHHETEFDPQLLHQREVEREAGRLVGDDLEGLDNALELDGCQEQRRGQLAVAESPVQPPEGERQRVGSGLLQPGPGAVTKPRHHEPMGLAVGGGIHRGLVAQHGAQDVGGQSVGVADLLGEHRTREVVSRADDHGGARGEQIGQGAEVLAGHEQGQLGDAARRVEQPVAQGEVQQGVLPRLHPRGRLGSARGGRGGSGYAALRRWGLRVALGRNGVGGRGRGSVFDDLDDTVLANASRRHGEHPHESGEVDVDHADQRRRVTVQIGVPRRLRRASEQVAGRASLLGEHGRLDDTHEPKPDRVDGLRALQAGRVGQPGVGRAPIAEEGVAADDPEDRVDAEVLQR